MQNKKAQKLRADTLMLQRGLAKTPQEASALIYSGKIYTKDRKIQNPSETLREDDFLGIKGQTPSKYVSRGGEKLESAIKKLLNPPNFTDKVVLDIGASTGGFTDYALKHGASKVIALDVGTNQLAWELRNNAKVISLEKTHIKDFKKNDYPSPDLILADISFNSLAQLAEPISKACSKNSTELLLLVKPQFELPKDLIPKGGIVTNEEHRKLALNLVIEAFLKFGFQVLFDVNCPVKGRGGNEETFLHLIKHLLPCAKV